jgi:hypothetical protein
MSHPTSNSWDSHLVPDWECSSARCRPPVDQWCEFEIPEEKQGARLTRLEPQRGGEEYFIILLDHSVRFKINSDQSLGVGLLVKDENHVAVVRIFVTKAILILQSGQHVDPFRNIVLW